MDESLVTYEPRVPRVVLDGEAEEIGLEARYRTGLGLDGEGAFDLRLVADGDEVPGGPAVGADPREVACRVAAAHRAHHRTHLLVGAEDYAACNITVPI